MYNDLQDAWGIAPTELSLQSHLHLGTHGLKLPLIRQLLYRPEPSLFLAASIPHEEPTLISIASIQASFPHTRSPSVTSVRMATEMIGIDANERFP